MANWRNEELTDAQYDRLGVMSGHNPFPYESTLGLFWDMNYVDTAILRACRRNEVLYMIRPNDLAPEISQFERVTDELKPKVRDATS